MLAILDFDAAIKLKILIVSPCLDQVQGLAQVLVCRHLEAKKKA